MIKNDKKLVNKIIDLCLLHEIKESNLYLKMLDNRIKFYQSQINYLEDTKPLFFQKKKLEEHNKKIEEYERKLFDTYKTMGEEVNCIIEMQNSIDNK